MVERVSEEGSEAVSDKGEGVWGAGSVCTIY